MVALSAKFWDRTARRYAETPVADEAAYQKKLQVTRGYLRPDMEVLEFGCGTGSTAIAHAPYVRHIQAIDISSKMIEIAQGKADAEHVTFETSTIEEFSAPDQSFDVVLGLNILHLLANKEDAIARVHDMLKPGGVFVTSTVCLGDMFWGLRLLLPVARIVGLAPLVRFFTMTELVKSVTDAGFEIDHQWQPGKGKWASVFVVAKKAGGRESTP